MLAEVIGVKTMEQLDEKTAVQVSEKNFEARQAERKSGMDAIKEEMGRWRYPQKVKVVTSKKYR